MTHLKKIRIALSIPFFAFSLLITLSSWDFKQSSPILDDPQPVSDTIPKKDKKIRDLDEVLDELNMADLEINMEKIQKEIAEAMSKIDKEKIRMEIDRAMKEVDIEKIKREMESSLAKIDWEKIKTEMEKVKEADRIKIETELKKVEEELKKIGPEIEKSMEKAKAGIEKARVEIQEYKNFIDGLEKDGLLNKKEGYTIIHKDGELLVNDKKVSATVYKKYQSFLEKHKKFNIKKKDGDFNIYKD